MEMIISFMVIQSVYIWGLYVIYIMEILYFGDQEYFSYIIWGYRKIFGTYGKTYGRTADENDFHGDL